MRELCLEGSRTDRGALRKIPAKHLGGQASHKRLLVLPDYSPIKEKQTHETLDSTFQKRSAYPFERFFIPTEA